MLGLLCQDNSFTGRRVSARFIACVLLTQLRVTHQLAQKFGFALASNQVS